MKAHLVLPRYRNNMKIRCSLVTPDDPMVWQVLETVGGAFIRDQLNDSLLYLFLQYVIVLLKEMWGTSQFETEVVVIKEGVVEFLPQQGHHIATMHSQNQWY